MKYTQPFVGPHIFKDGNRTFIADIVGSFAAPYFLQHKSKRCFLVRGENKDLRGWSELVGDLRVINEDYLVGPATSLFKELL